MNPMRLIRDRTMLSSVALVAVILVFFTTALYTPVANAQDANATNANAAAVRDQGRLSLDTVPSLEGLARDAQSKVVKIYGAGGIRGLEAYQSGFLVSPEGHIATAWSYVLDVDPIVQLDDGSRHEAKVLQFEPSLELALLKIDITEVPFFKIEKGLEPQWGDPVMAVSNLFNIATGNEAASVMQGSIASAGPLDARRGTFETPYRGEVLLLDLIANNPGAAGGALVDFNGRLIGMLGKELRDSKTGVWLNYAIPASVLRQAIADMVAGRKLPPPVESTPILPRDDSHNPARLGMVMIPDVLESTPAFIDRVNNDSSAGRALLMPDDLVLMVGSHRIDSQRTFRDRLRRIDRRDDVQLTLQRGNEIMTVTLEPIR